MAVPQLAYPLRVVLVWRGEALQEKVFYTSQIITVGASPKDTFTVAANQLGDGFALLSPTADGAGFAVTLAPGMTGKLHVDGIDLEIADLVGGRGGGGGRQQPFGMRDWGIVSLESTGEIALFFQHLEGAPRVAPQFGIDKFFAQGLAFAGLCLISLLVIAFWAWDKEDQLDIDPPPSEAIAKLLLDVPEPKVEEKKEKNARKVREDDASKKAAGKEGKIGEKSAKVEKTVIPKGPRDQIAAKVSNMGLLGALKPSKESKALNSLLSDNANSDITTALAGVKGANLQVGRGSGGMGLRGDGGGGGGKGMGQLMGSGDLAIGGGGKGARNTGTGGGHVAKETKVGLTTGTPSADGGLSKEQILKVVQSHAAAIQFCYEKELQRFPHLAGKIIVDWKVDLDGRVQMAKIGSTSLNNASTESCMVRQVKAWQFPKPNGVMCNVSFPFFFKGQ